MTNTGSSNWTAGVSFLIAHGTYYLQGENGWGERSCAREFAAEKERAEFIKKLRKTGFENVYAVNVEQVDNAARWADRIEAASREGVAVENKLASSGAYASASEAAAYRHGLERAAWLLRNRPDENA